MKICLSNVTASFLAGGLETYCWEVGRALAQRGHAVTLATGIPPQGQAPRHTEIACVTFPFKIEQSWPKFGTRFRRLMERGSFYRHALDWLIQENFDAIIINKPFDFPYLWWAKQRGLKSKIVFRSGGREFFFADRWFAKAIDIWASTSRYNAAQVEAHYQQPVQVIHNGVDAKRFTFQASERAILRQAWHTDYAIPLDGFVIGSVGRIVGWKGLRVILEAMPHLPTQVHYVACGEGDAQAELAALATQLGVQHRVHFVGKIAHQALPNYLSAFDSFVQPSIGEESFGISVVEAMACARPTLVSNNGGLTEIIHSAAVGTVLPKGESLVWREALANLVDNPTLCEQLGQAARQRVLEHFTWASNAAQLEALIDQCTV